MARTTSSTTGSTEKTATTERTKRVAEPKAAKPAAAKPAAKEPTARTTTPSRSKSAEAAPDTAAPLSAEDRARYVAEAAYYIAERRGFPGGTEAQDWLDAETQIDAMLAGSSTRH
jgi:hypothetical protein